jgi:spore maturation protein CgeB
MQPELYSLPCPDLDMILEGADVVLVHEWNTPDLVRDIGRKRAAGGRFLLLFHDTHHRMATDPESAREYELNGFDGVLAFGEVIRNEYDRRGWSRRAWTWHEAADVDLFSPCACLGRPHDLVWIGNWGDDERTRELEEFVFDPIRDLSLQATIFGVRYPDEALESVLSCGAAYGGWLPNHRVPETFACHLLTVHVPRRPYVQMLPGIPTIRVFEALACGIPLLCSPWEDTEGLFSPGEDYLLARNGREMKQLIRQVLNDRDLAQSLVEHGMRTIHQKHTCLHRIEELMSICSELQSFEP